MEPRQFSPENAPPTPSQPERDLTGNAETSLPVAETGVDAHRNEQTERRLGHQVETVSRAPALPPPPLSGALPAPVALPPADTSATVADDTPIVAADDDLIEKEWVDKAKQVIASTKDDPSRRESEVKKLQIEYVKKRYGRVIGATNVD